MGETLTIYRYVYGNVYGNKIEKSMNSTIVANKKNPSCYIKHNNKKKKTLFILYVKLWQIWMENKMKTNL